MTHSWHLPRAPGCIGDCATLEAALALGVFRPAAVLLAALLLAACNPALNWRETRIKGSGLLTMLPCKPDEGARVVPLGGRDVSLHMVGCDAAGATFAVAYANLDNATAPDAVLAQWRAATLAHMGAVASREVPLRSTATSSAAGRRA